MHKCAGGVGKLEGVIGGNYRIKSSEVSRRQTSRHIKEIVQQSVASEGLKYTLGVISQLMVFKTVESIVKEEG